MKRSPLLLTLILIGTPMLAAPMLAAPIRVIPPGEAPGEKPPAEKPPAEKPPPREKRPAKGPIRPLPREFLSEPIALRCGVTIVESRPSRPSPTTIARLNAVCDLATREIRSFAKDYGLGEIPDYPPKWGWGFLPDNTRARSLGDRDRFFPQHPGGDPYAITFCTKQFTVEAYDVNNPYFYESFAHEMYHVFGCYYRFFYDEEGENYELNERHARAFTARLRSRARAVVRQIP